MIENFNKICRTCLIESQDSKSLFDVQYVNAEQLRLCEIFTAFTSIEVLENDDLPKRVCLQCEHNIISTYSFQQQCQKSDSLLRTITSQPVQSDLIELKPLESLEETSLNSTIQFSQILSNTALDVHDQDDNYDNEVDNYESLNTVIEDQFTSNVIINKDNESFVTTKSYGIESNNQENHATVSYSFNIVNQPGDDLTSFNINHEQTEDLCQNIIIKNDIKIEGEDETLQPIFACEEEGCFKCFTDPKDLKKHSKTHFANPNYCKICNMTFASSSTLSRHLSSKHEPQKKLHLCTDCGKTFARSDDLKRHSRIHTGERPFSCEKCGKSYAQSFRLLEHVRSHSDVKNFICAICGKGFTRYTSLLAHNKTHSNVKSHKCETCGKRLCGPGSLAMHMKLHTGVKDYVCNICKKRFASSSNLIVHRRTHTGERPYSCSTCLKSFADISRLNVHSRIHSGEKPYVCSYCGRGCVSSTQLKRHVRLHTGEKPYECQLCTKTFARNEDLKNHIKIHKGERNHICTICQKGFFQASTLKVHMRIHTGEKPYTCSICNKGFGQIGSYSSHMMKAHTDNINDPKYAALQTDVSDHGKEAIIQFL